MFTAIIKEWIRQTLPKSAYIAILALWRGTKYIGEELLAFCIGLRILAGGGRLPDRILYFGLSPGDDLLCTSIVAELCERGKDSSLMLSNYPELFVGLALRAYVEPIGADRSGARKVQRYRRVARIWGRAFHHLEYARYDGRDQSIAPHRHIIAELCASAGVAGSVSIRPYLILDEREKEIGLWARGQIAIQSSGMSARLPMRNKQWYPERFQMVVEVLRNEFRFVQLGSKNDPLLNEVTDLRGSTSIRESAAILHHTRVYIGTVGFLMHLARAVDCPSVIVYGGREAPWQSGYACNVNLYSAVPCAPCWRWNTCDFDRRCMADITVDDVVRGVREIVGRSRDQLGVERVEI
jgi:hypothetical protein